MHNSQPLAQRRGKTFLIHGVAWTKHGVAWTWSSMDKTQRPERARYIQSNASYSIWLAWVGDGK